MSKILFGLNGEAQNGAEEIIEVKKAAAIPNLFKGATEPKDSKASFPTWDILPPNQFINPRIKK